jgi:hypothetical protein
VETRRGNYEYNVYFAVIESVVEIRGPSTSMFLPDFLRKGFVKIHDTDEPRAVRIDNLLRSSFAHSEPNHAETYIRHDI